MTSRGARRRRERHLIHDLERGRRRRRPPLPTTVLWRWRYELVVVATVGLTGRGLALLVGLDTVVPLFLSTAAALWSWPASREVIFRALWHLITPHRVRQGCVAAGIHTDGGRLPTVLSTRAIAGGHQVVLWCPAGCSVEDFQENRHVLRAACWASDVQVHRHPQYSHMVYLDIVRESAPRNSDGDRGDAPRIGSIRRGHASSRDRVAGLRRHRPVSRWTRVRGVSRRQPRRPAEPAPPCRRTDGGSRGQSGDPGVDRIWTAATSLGRGPRGRPRGEVTGAEGGVR